jgi:uncharacterized protein YndB with AHSA1/START domain
MRGRPTGLFLELRCVLEDPSARVFEALTDPAALAVWWGPAGFTTPEIALDLTVGGAYRFGMQPPEGDLFHLVGEFLEIEPPSRLVYTFRWEEPDPDDQDTIVELSLHEAGDTTELSLRQGEFATEARFELHRQGWTDGLERLRELIDSGSWTGGAKRPAS